MQDLFQTHLLSAIVFSPFILSFLLFLIPKSQENIIKIAALVISLFTFGLSLVLYHGFQAGVDSFQFVEQHTWLPSIGINYSLGVDGISLLLIVLTTFLIPVIVLSCWHAVENKIRGYLFCMLFLETGILGAFVSTDLFLFYIFWEAMLIPMFFLIGIWGSADRIYAATKFMIYTVAGSVPMLIAIIYLLLQHKLQFGNYSANILDLYKLNLPAGSFFSVQGWLFLAFALAFMIKVPLFPLHTWLPDAHVQAPTGGSVILAGVLLKLGGYGLIRFAMPFSAAVIPLYAPYVMTVAAIAIVYGACVAIAQTDIKKMVAYSSVSHMGYVILGLFALNQIGVMGSVYQMLNHGVSTGALFLLVGILYERKHTKDIAAYSGLAKSIPLFSIVMIIITFSSIALPGTNGFIGEFLILQGAFLANPYLAAVAATGVILGAVYMLWLCQRILFGKPETTNSDKLADLNCREVAYLLPFIALVVYMGLFPKTFFHKMDSSVRHYTGMIQHNNPQTSSAPAIGTPVPPPAVASPSASTSSGDTTHAQYD